jgi:hypothetical protein
MEYVYPSCDRGYFRNETCSSGKPALTIGVNVIAVGVPVVVTMPPLGIGADVVVD